VTTFVTKSASVFLQLAQESARTVPTPLHYAPPAVPLAAGIDVVWSEIQRATGSKGTEWVAG